MEQNEQLRDELLLALDSLSWFEELGEVYNANRARAKVKELRKYMDAPTTDVITTGVCPVCGLDLSAFPHTEEECLEWFMADYRDADQTRADLLQF